MGRVRAKYGTGAKAPKSHFFAINTGKEKQGFVLALCVSKVPIILSDTQRPSVLLALRPLRTSNSNDMRLIALCFVVIVKKDRWLSFF